MKDFNRKKGGARELLTEEKVIFRPGYLFLGGGVEGGEWGREMTRVLSCRLPLHFLWGDVESPCDRLL